MTFDVEFEKGIKRGSLYTSIDHMKELKVLQAINSVQTGFDWAMLSLSVGEHLLTENDGDKVVKVTRIY